MNSKEKILWGEFLELYESMPCLWKIKSAEYCNREIYIIIYNRLYIIDPEANRKKVVKKNVIINLPIFGRSGVFG